MKNILLRIVLISAAFTPAWADSKCADYNVEKSVIATAKRWTTQNPEPTVYERMSYNFNYTISDPNVCCVTFDAEEMMEKPGCPAYRSICVDLRDHQVKRDKHHYNGWCDY